MGINNNNNNKQTNKYNIITSTREAEPQRVVKKNPLQRLQYPLCETTSSTLGYINGFSAIIEYLATDGTIIHQSLDEFLA